MDFTDFKKHNKKLIYKVLNIVLKIFNKITFYTFDKLSLHLNLYIVFLREDRIGHQAGNADVEFHKATKRKKEKNSKTIFIFPYEECKVANKYLRNKLINYCKENYHKVIVFRKNFFNNFFSKLVIYSLPRIFKSCKNIYVSPSDRGKRLSKNILNFNANKSSIFEDLGIKKRNYVCIYARDDKYLNTLGMNKNWNYHQYRNSNIDNLKLISEWIVENKEWHIVRIGSYPNKKISWAKNDKFKIIDYSFSGLRSEKNDIELISNCSLYISNGGGPESVAIAARREIIKINQVPLGDEHGYIFGLWLPKLHIKNKSKEYLSLIEICELGIEFTFNGNAFINSKVSLVENSPSEIINLFNDYIKYKNNKFSKEEKLLINEYHRIRKIISKKWGILQCNKNFIAPSFLKKYNNLLRY